MAKDGLFSPLAGPPQPGRGAGPGLVGAVRLGLPAMFERQLRAAAQLRHVFGYPVLPHHDSWHFRAAPHPARRAPPLPRLGLPPAAGPVRGAGGGLLRHPCSIAPDTAEYSRYGLGLVALGLPVYFLFGRKMGEV